MKVAADLPQAHQQSENETGGTEGRGHVVAEELRIAEDISHAGVVVCVPKRKRDCGNQSETTRSGRVSAKRHNLRNDVRCARKPAIPQAASARGARIAVSLARAARENHSMVASLRSSVYAERPQKIRPAAGQVYLRQGALREEYRVDGGAQRSCNRNSRIGDILGQAKKSQQRKRGEEQHGRPRDQRGVTDDLPP